MPGLLTTPAVPQPAPTNQQLTRQFPGWSVPAFSTVRLRYIENSPILVRGAATGRHYSFSGARSIQAVDVRDAAAFLRTRFFRRAS